MKQLTIGALATTKALEVNTIMNDMSHHFGGADYLPEF